MSNPLTYISLFSSAGFGGYGFKMKSWKKDHKITNPDVIIATPPCQRMSIANHKKNNEPGRNSLVVESIKITSDVQPKFFIFENVRTFLKTICTDIDGVEKPIESAIKENLGGHYNILFRIINFKVYGSPSDRTRTLVIGVRKDLLNISPYDIFPNRQNAKTLLKHIPGEAVPTGVLKSIAENIIKAVKKNMLSLNEVNKLITCNNLKDPDNLKKFIEDEFEKLGIENIFLIAEHSNSARQDSAAYFTRKDIVYNVVKDLPDFVTIKSVRILEPAAGVGNFIPSLIEKYREKVEVVIDLLDIDYNSLEILKTILKKINPPPNFRFNFLNYDYLLWTNNFKYDLVVGNPPYMKLTNKTELLSRYKAQFSNNDTNNFFSFFIEKALLMGNYVSFIVPKSLINAPEFNKTRSLLNKYDVLKITDYGEKGFNGVLIETISFLINTTNTVKTKNIIVESYINNSYCIKEKHYILTDDYPYWLIYRNPEFDRVALKMQFDIFISFRDRQITKSITKPAGRIRVLKSRNIGSNAIKDISGYDCYLDNIDNLVVSRFLDREDVIMVPNLTNYPRAAFFPKNSITDGSVALLTLKNGFRKPTEQDLAFYGSKEFEYFYRVARNFGTRSLNIDNNSVFFFGVLKEPGTKNKQPGRSMINLHPSL